MLAREIFDQQRGAKEKVPVIFSDMRQQTRGSGSGVTFDSAEFRQDREENNQVWRIEP
jgi:hypothetical protein